MKSHPSGHLSLTLLLAALLVSRSSPCPSIHHSGPVSDQYGDSYRLSCQDRIDFVADKLQFFPTIPETHISIHGLALLLGKLSFRYIQFIQ